MPKVSILVADDLSFIQPVAAAVLSGGRFQIVASTASCEETLEAIEPHDPVIVLPDIDWSGMNGVQAARSVACAVQQAPPPP